MAYPSTFLDLQNEVIAKVRLDATADLQKTKDWLNQVYSDVCVDTEALQTIATMTLTASTSTYTLDTTIARIKQMYVTPAGGTASRPLEPISVEAMLELTAGTGGSQPNTGGPNRYAIFGLTSIQFYPTPASADTITLYYVKFPTALSANADVPVLPEPYATHCLVNGASYKAAMFLKDPDAALFQRDYEFWRAKLRAHLRRLQGSMTRQFRISRDTPFVPHDPSTDVRLYQ